jgi:diguanylate cyclase (GGDEF)-like protein
MTPSSTTTVGVLPPDVVTLIPYSAARRLRAIAVAATSKEVTVLIPESGDGEVASELRSLTGLRVATIDTPAERIDTLLDRLAGSLETDDLWLQRRHIQALSRLVDHSVNMGQVDQVRSLVDRALEFAPYSAELWLMKARVSSQRTQVIRALTIASDIAPNDRRVLRWTQSLQDLETDVAEDEVTATPPRRAGLWGSREASNGTPIEKGPETEPASQNPAEPGTSLVSVPSEVAPEVEEPGSKIEETAAMPPDTSLAADETSATDGEQPGTLQTAAEGETDVMTSTFEEHVPEAVETTAAEPAGLDLDLQSDAPEARETQEPPAATVSEEHQLEPAKDSDGAVVSEQPATQAAEPAVVMQPADNPVTDETADTVVAEGSAQRRATPDTTGTNTPSEGIASAATSAEPAHAVSDALLESALELTKIQDLGVLLQRTGEIAGKLAAADSATVFFMGEKSWVGWTNDQHLEEHLTRAVPRQDRLAAQVIKQGLPMAISDTASRVEDVGRLICDAGVRSFALLPIRTGDEVGGLIYLNYRTINRADMIFAPNLGRRIEVVLTCAGAAALAIRRKDEVSQQPAAFDPLTGVYSLEQFERLLGTEIDRARRYRYSVALLSLDVDDFSRVNSLYGRNTGDQVLQELCSRVLSLGRSSDVLARRADDEFLFMLPQTTGKGAEILARRIHGAMEDPVVAEKDRVTASLSIGLASFPERADDAQGLIQAAEIALYGAKAQGKHRTHVADTLSLSS